jgi:hypothetical protein
LTRTLSSLMSSSITTSQTQTVPFRSVQSFSQQPGGSRAYPEGLSVTASRDGR